MIEFNINFLFTIINLLVLFFLLKKFLFDKVNNIIEQRQAEADEQLSQAAKLKKDAEDMKSEYEQTLANADSIKKDIISKATNEADKQADLIIENAKEQAQSIINESKQQGEKEHQKIINETSNEINGIVCDALRSIAIKCDETNTDNKALLDDFLAKVGEE